MQLGAFSLSLAVRDIAASAAAYEDTAGPASFVVLDAGGNPILVDQHV